MQEWVEAGFDPDAFWHQTPRLFAICMAGRAEAINRECDGMIWLAWHTAALVRVPKMPSLQTLLTSAAPAKPQTSDDHFAIFSAIAAQSQRKH